MKHFINKTMKDLLNNSILEQPDQYHKIFSHNKPFRHIVIDSFFNDKFCQSLLDEFPGFDTKLATNENGEVFIKIPTNEISNEFKFIINGFSENGLLFNTIFNTGLPDF